MSLRYLTAGESHGKALIGIIEGLPSQIPIDLEKLKHQMQRRKMGYGRGFRMKIEDDAVEILSGVRLGKTMGSPVSLAIWNKDWQNWQDIMCVEEREGEIRRTVNIPRPGHADYLGHLKYAHHDMRNVLERSSARETAARVALGSLVRQFLEALDIHIGSRIIQIGSASDDSEYKGAVKDLNDKADSNEVRCLNANASKEMIEAIEEAKKEGDTLGGIFEAYAEGVPVALGSYAQWDRRLEGKIAAQLMSLNAIKGVEFGIGFEHAKIRGSKAHDEFFPGKKNAKHLTYKTNRSGGITGGMTTGQRIITRVAMKPISTLMKPLDSVDLRSGESVKAHVERSDTCAAPAAAVIGESLLAFALAEAVLEKFGGDSLEEVKSRVESWRDQTESQ